jgi:site-specific recombinase XerD
MAQHLLQQGRSRKEVQQMLGLSSANAMRLHRVAADSD